MLIRQIHPDAHVRLPEPRDAEELYALVEANRERLRRWLPWVPSQDLEATRAFIVRARSEYAALQSLNLVIVQGDRIAGAGGFNRIDWPHRAATIGYWIDRAAEGQGLVSAMVNALAEHAFGTWDLHRLDLRAGVENARSRAVAERCGFQYEGVARDAELVDGRWVSHAVYSRLAG